MGDICKKATCKRSGEKKMDQPKVSVIMGIYNCESTLSEAINSILGQSYTNWELVMCDDGSTDGTYALAEQYREKYPEKIILLKNERNMKLSYTLNRCLEKASGELIARMDGDDISHRDRLQTQVRFLQTHSDIQLVGCAMQRFDERGLHDIMHPVVSPDKWTLRYRVPFFHATILTYKWVYDTLKGYNVSDSVTRVEDRDLWFRFYANAFKGANIDEVLYDVRENKETISRRTVRSRFHSLQTTARGFQLLGYPKRWLITEVLLLTAKSLIPYRVKQWVRDVRYKS